MHRSVRISVLVHMGRQFCSTQDFLKLKGCENVMVPMVISRSMLAPVRILLCVSLPSACYISPSTCFSPSPFPLPLSLMCCCLCSHPVLVCLCPSCLHLWRSSSPPLPHPHSFCPPCPLKQPSSLACVVPPGAGLWNLLKGGHFFAKINSLSC